MDGQLCIRRSGGKKPCANTHTRDTGDQRSKLASLRPEDPMSIQKCHVGNSRPYPVLYKRRHCDGRSVSKGCFSPSKQFQTGRR
jgi:hypothetical protein